MTGLVMVVEEEAKYIRLLTRVSGSTESWVRLGRCKSLNILQEFDSHQHLLDVGEVVSEEKCGGEWWLSIGNH